MKSPSNVQDVEQVLLEKSQVDFVLRGEFDYQQISSPTGPIAYPAGFCWLYGTFRWFNLEVSHVQCIFAGLYLANMLVLMKIYRHAKAPLWVFALCILRLAKKRSGTFSNPDYCNSERLKPGQKPSSFVTHCRHPFTKQGRWLAGRLHEASHVMGISQGPSGAIRFSCFGSSTTRQRSSSATGPCCFCWKDAIGWKGAGRTWPGYVWILFWKMEKTD